MSRRWGQGGDVSTRQISGSYTTNSFLVQFLPVVYRLVCPELKPNSVDEDTVDHKNWNIINRMESSDCQGETYFWLWSLSVWSKPIRHLHCACLQIKCERFQQFTVPYSLKVAHQHLIKEPWQRTHTVHTLIHATLTWAFYLQAVDELIIFSTSLVSIFFVLQFQGEDVGVNPQAIAPWIIRWLQFWL